MCEVQIVQKLGNKKLNKKDIGEFLKLMCFGSRKNRDAFGVFNERYIFKKGVAFNIGEVNQSKLIKSKFLIGHNRLSTSAGEVPPIKDMLISCIPLSGKINPKYSEENLFKINNSHNHHPFKLDSFILCHNGIVFNDYNLRNKFKIKTKIKTDSYIILYLINHYFKKTDKNLSRIKRIEKAIKKTTKQLDGSYSVILYDSKGKNLIHFRNASIELYFYKYKDVLCGSSCDFNLKYLYEDKKEEIFTFSNNIYLITNDTKKPIKSIGRFKEKETPPLSPSPFIQTIIKEDRKTEVPIYHQFFYCSIFLFLIVLGFIVQPMIILFRAKILGIIELIRFILPLNLLCLILSKGGKRKCQT